MIRYNRKGYKKFYSLKKENLRDYMIGEEAN